MTARPRVIASLLFLATFAPQDVQAGDCQKTDDLPECLQGDPIPLLCAGFMAPPDDVDLAETLGVFPYYELDGLRVWVGFILARGGNGLGDHQSFVFVGIKANVSACHYVASHGVLQYWLDLPPDAQGRGG